MLVIYRLAHVKSPLSNPPFVYEEDLFKLNAMCLKSTLMGIGDAIEKIVFICDFCPKGLYEPLLNTVNFEKEIHWTEKGINETALMQYDIANEAKNEVILFQECDYLYRPVIGKRLENAIKEFGLVTPYDNLNYYMDKNMHSEDVKIKLFEDQHYRTVERSVMTFGMTNEAFKKCYENFKKWGYLDGDIWTEVKANGYTLHVPIPSFATHTARDFLAPGLDWERLVDFYGEPKSKTN